MLLISIDALRADRLTVYGHPRPTSPFLAELAASGAVFENAFVN
ncbi:MAG TPA: sulfatase-like hydrolase/transferase, partial [Thermoanaerobaculia bacterium]|nr:sulfatase-like hydrolase/transferase [Thermoanaerobaculia bacterium]